MLQFRFYGGDKVINFNQFYQQLGDTDLQDWLETLPALLGQWQRENRHGDLPKWMKVIDKLPNISANEPDLTTGVTISAQQPLDDNTYKKLANLLQQLAPWRKGPYTIHGLNINTEWRSDWKWQRLLPHISPLKHRTILDVGCGNGYHMWRMLGAGAKQVIGVDPAVLFLCQFVAIKRLIGSQFPIHLLPLAIENIPASCAFDTVFSMGVLYHRRSPIDHLLQLQQQLKDGGELVLETLVVDGDETTALMPTDRYGKMNNVWFLPSVKMLYRWLEKVNFIDIRCVDVNTTSPEEQRSTPWMTSESLVDYLDPNNHCLTVEGYPAPKRAIFIATKKERLNKK